MENLQELKELNQRQANVDFESMLGVYRETEEEMKRREVEEDERQIRWVMLVPSVFGFLVTDDTDVFMLFSAGKCWPRLRRGGGWQTLTLKKNFPLMSLRKPRT